MSYAGAITWLLLCGLLISGVAGIVLHRRRERLERRQLKLDALDFQGYVAEATARARIFYAETPQDAVRALAEYGTRLDSIARRRKELTTP